MVGSLFDAWKDSEFSELLFSLVSTIFCYPYFLLYIFDVSFQNLVDNMQSIVMHNK